MYMLYLENNNCEAAGYENNQSRRDKTQHHLFLQQ